MTWVKATPHNLLLFEKTIRYASQTESAIKHHCYAYFIFNSLQDKSMEDVQKETILNVVSELNEIEILYLISLGQEDSLFTETNFHKKYGIYIDRRSACGSEDDRKFNAMQDAYLNNLLVKGLTICVNDPKKGLSGFQLLDFGRIVCDALYDEEYFEREG